MAELLYIFFICLEVESSYINAISGIMLENTPMHTKNDSSEKTASDHNYIDMFLQAMHPVVTFLFYATYNRLL